MKEFFENLFGRGGSKSQPVNSPVPEVAVDWSQIIWAYTQSFWATGWSLKNYDHAAKECRDRGLAFGQLRILEAREYGIKFGLLGEQKLGIVEVKTALQQAVEKAGLAERVTVREGIMSDEVIAVLDGVAKDDDPPSQGCSGWKSGESFSWRQFLSVRCYQSGGLYEMEAPSEEALRVLVACAEILGFKAGPKHYAYESPVPIEDIIVYAVRWEDPQTGCRYLDVLWRPELVKAQVWHGSGPRDERAEGAYKGEVFACRPGCDWWPKISINNRPVYSTIVNNPTTHMLKAKEKFAKDAVRNCSYCGKLDTREFFHTRVQMGDSFMGGMTFACDDSVCAEKAKAQKALSTTEHPYQQEVWAR